MQSDNEDEIDQLMNHFNTEFIAPEDIELTNNPGNVGAVTLEANVHVVDKGTTHKNNYRQTKRKINPEKSTPITWKCNISPHSQENYLLKGRVANQFEKNASALDIFEQIINLNVLIEVLVYLFKKVTSICNKTGGSFSPMSRK